jgi:hypothetical protein
LGQVRLGFAGFVAKLWHAHVPAISSFAVVFAEGIMAWTNVDDEFRARGAHQLVAKFLRDAGFEGWDEQGARVLGHVAMLWGNSQSLKRDTGSADEIIIWSQLYEALKQSELGKKWIELLCGPGVMALKAKKNGNYSILGNKKHIANRTKKKKAAILGGEANKKRIEELNKKSGVLNDSHNEATRLDGGSPDGTNVETQHGIDSEASLLAQGNSRQGNANQNKATQISSRQCNEGEPHPWPTGQFKIHPEFAGRKVLDPTLSLISEQTQAAWLEEYPDPEWLRANLHTAILFHKENGVGWDELGGKLVTWLPRQKDRPRRKYAYQGACVDDREFDETKDIFGNPIPGVEQ